MDVLEYINHASSMGEESPAGPNLEYDELFMELGRYLIPKTASMVTTDDEDGEDGVDWRAATELAESLLEKSRDIRIAVSLGRCAVETKGLNGLCSSIALIRSLLENMWMDVHPAPEADEDMDLMMRYNALGGLSNPALVVALKAAPLAISVTKLPVSLNTIEMAIGKKVATSDDERTQASGIVDEVFAASDTSALVAVKKSADQAAADLNEIVQIWRNEVGAMADARSAEDLAFDAMEAPGFEDLLRVYTDISRHITERLPELKTEEEEAGENGTQVAGKNITTRADAAVAITRVIEWFQHNEPSSPIPNMLERARSMISKSFLEIVDELGDGGIAEARKAAGQSPREDGGGE